MGTLKALVSVICKIGIWRKSVCCNYIYGDFISLQISPSPHGTVSIRHLAELPVWSCISLAQRYFVLALVNLHKNFLAQIGMASVDHT